MSLKQKIIETSITYFNENGFMNTSMRNIAIASDMSLSNLQYHFKTKQVLIEGIVDEMYKLFEGIFDYKEEAVDLMMLINLADYWFDFQRKFIFFYKEISAIMQQYPTVSKKYLFIKEKRTNEMESLLKTYASFGVMKPEQFPNYYKSMADLLFFITNFHLSAELSFGQKNIQTCFNEANTLCYDLLLPSLTEQGLFFYNSIINDKQK
jgi:AcrR family transcriptional regulator